MDKKYFNFMARACTRRSALATGTGLLLAGFGGSRPVLAQQATEPLKIKGQVKADGKRAEATQQVRAGQEVSVSPGGSAAFAVGNDGFIVKGQDAAHAFR